MPPPEASWISLARLVRPQGRKGELLADLLTDFPERFEQHPVVFVAPAETTASPEELASFAVTSSWLPHGRNQGRIVLGLAGVDSIEKAERLAGLDVLVPGSDRFDLTDDSVYISDLIGCTLFDGDVPVGTVEDVQFVTSPDGKRRLTDAAPLLTVIVPNGEALVPFAKDFLVSVDLPERRIRMRLPAGLVDVNNRPEPLAPALEAES